MPAPPAASTASLFSTRGTMPRRHSTTAWSTTWESRLSATHSAEPASAASTRVVAASPGVMEAPERRRPLPSVTVALKVRGWVLAPTAVTQGAIAGEPRHAADRPPPDPEQRRGDVGVAGRGGRRMRPVAVRVARRQVLLGQDL